ncbi:MAG: hypothetical protein ACE5G8_09650 [Anaerolineae bacterium]
MKQLFPLLLLIALAACGGQPPPPVAGSAPLPSGPARPPTPLPPSSPSPDTLMFESVPRQTFTHTNGLFTIEYPANWQPFEQANGVIFVDPTQRAAYGVLFSQADAAMSGRALTDFAARFVQANFGNEAGFKILSAGEGVIQFTSADPHLGAAVQDISVFQQGPRVYFTQIMVAEAQWAASAAAVRQLAGTLQILSDQALPPATPTPPPPPAWTLYAHPAQHIVFLRPSNWTITQTERSAAATWPEQRFTFAVEVVAAPGAGSDVQRVETFTRQAADQLAAQFSGAEMLPVTAYRVGQTTGYTFDYLYPGPEGFAVAGSIIAVGIGDAIYRVSISAPALTYDTALEWYFNPMLQSFQVLPPP